MTTTSKSKDEAKIGAEPEAELDAEAIAEAEEQAALDLATDSLTAQIHSEQPLRMIDDTYYGIVAAGRRFNAGEGELGSVQAELDRVFGEGAIAAADITTKPAKPEPEAKQKPEPEAKHK